MLDFAARIARGPVLLDGASGTELQRRGVPTRLPLWSAAAVRDNPDTVRQIHADYVAAGAELITANTFRTHRRNLVQGGILDADAAQRWTADAVRLAREAAGDRSVFVFGSQAPLEDCYSPDRVPSNPVLADEHRQMSVNLAAAGVDGILVETHNAVREAVAAARAAAATGLPILVSAVCGVDGRLLSGETIGHFVRAVRNVSRPLGLMVNCGPAPTLRGPLQELSVLAGDVRFGAYGNIGEPDAEFGWRNTDAQEPARYAEYVQQWLDLGAGLVGGCCGTTPAHIRQLVALPALRQG